MMRFDNDLVACQEEMNSMVEGKQQLDSHTVNDLSGMVAKLNSLISADSAQRLLSSIDNLMECQTRMENFASSKYFISSLMYLLDEYKPRIFSAKSSNIKSSQYAKHDCYRLTLSMLLRLLNQGHILLIFVRIISRDTSYRLIRTISEIIGLDWLYKTQVL